VQLPDFVLVFLPSPSSSDVQVVPASWLIPTDGRQADTPADECEDEDAVCQVCFEGESLEYNPIVFCDRCNIAVHKVRGQRNLFFDVMLVCPLFGTMALWLAALLWNHGYSRRRLFL
jgi:hypothetical protein